MIEIIIFILSVLVALIIGYLVIDHHERKLIEGIYQKYDIEHIIMNEEANKVLGDNNCKQGFYENCCK